MNMDKWKSAADVTSDYMVKEEKKKKKKMAKELSEFKM